MIVNEILVGGDWNIGEIYGIMMVNDGINNG